MAGETRKKKGGWGLVRNKECMGKFSPSASLPWLIPHEHTALSSVYFVKTVIYLTHGTLYTPAKKSQNSMEKQIMCIFPFSVSASEVFISN